MFVDPDININKKHFKALFKAILKEKQKKNISKNTKFIIQARIDSFDREMLEISKKTGIIALIGVESLSKRIRKYDLNKGGKLANMGSNELKKSIDKLRRYMGTYLYFILATPKTKWKELKENLNFIKNLKKGWYEINIHITPYYETNYYEKYKNSNLMVWKEGNYTKLPYYLKCADKKVEKAVGTAYERAIKTFKKHKKIKFSTIFLKELLKEANLQ